VPDDATPGKYAATVRLGTANGSSDVLTLRLEVLPYQLQDPPGIVWGLYPDSGRWNAFSDEQIEAEMTAMRDHGINALMLYPLRCVQFTVDNGKMSADFAPFRRQMQLYRKVGLGGPMVISIQAGESFVRNLLGDAGTDRTVLTDAYRQMLELIKQESIDDEWPPFCLHSVDEPHSGEKAERVMRTLRLIKDVGFDTFNTCYGKFVRDYLDPVLDYRCYNNIGFLSMASEEATAALREETLAAGDHFWWYGTGCYTNRGLIQDGNVVVNRFMGGFHFWRTRATGAWAWTFLRPKGSAYDDFDGQSAREHKDACTAYPTPDGRGLVPTLQWEAIREGVDDYKYLHTLMCAIRDARTSKVPAAARAADRAEATVEKMLAEMPWSCANGAVTNADVDRARARIVELTLAVRAARRD
jgi:hypothetical protein